MRIPAALVVLLLAGCAAGPPAPCNPPMVVDVTGNCVVPDRMIHRR